MASSTSTINPNEFPGVPEETLRKFIIKQEVVIDAEDDENFSEEIFVNKVFLTKHRTLPNSMRNVYPMKDAEKCLTAIQTELNSLKNFKAYEVVKIPNEHQVVSTRFVFTKKYSDKTNSERNKFRLFVRGFEFKTNFGDTLTPTLQLDALHLITPYCASMASSVFPLYSIDFVSAFLNAISDPNVYVTFPIGVKIPDGYCRKLKKPLYGTARASRLWRKTLENSSAVSDFFAPSHMTAYITERRMNSLNLISFTSMI